MSKESFSPRKRVTISENEKADTSTVKLDEESEEERSDSSPRKLEMMLKEGFPPRKKHVMILEEERAETSALTMEEKSEESTSDFSSRKLKSILIEEHPPRKHVRILEEERPETSTTRWDDEKSEENRLDFPSRKLQTIVKEEFSPRKHAMIVDDERPETSTTKLDDEKSEESKSDFSSRKLKTMLKEGFSPKKHVTISEEERPESSTRKFEDEKSEEMLKEGISRRKHVMILEEESSDSRNPKMISKEERLDVLDPLSRPSVSTSQSPILNFKRERREMSVSPARKTITDHLKDSEPFTATDRADLTAAMARKTVTSTPLAPLSLKERRELVRSISIMKEPETPLWFSEDKDDKIEEGPEGAEEEPETVEVQPMHRAPELTMGQSRFAPRFTRAQSSALTRLPTKRVFPLPNLKDDEVINPFSNKERRALVRSLSIAVTSVDTSMWNADSTDVSESEDGRPRGVEEQMKAPLLLSPDPEELKKPKKLKPTKRHRKVRVHVTDLARSHAVDSLEFCSNKVKSAKYSVATFLPLNLFGQCFRAANLYFILIAALQLIPGFSPTSWGTTMAPLAFVLLLNATKEALDDFKRNLSDRTINKQKVDVFNEGQFLPMNWSSVVVGDIVRVKRDHEFPADLVFLSSSDPKGLAYIETSNLDGEPSLKLRNAFYKGTQASAEEEDDSSLSIFSGLVIECELPNNRLYKFDGTVNLQDYGKLPLDIRQVFLRGATLRNTDWILGVVVYTGADTKFVRNMIPGQHKITELEKNMNILVTLIFFCQVALCIGLAVGQDKWARKNTNLFYIPYDIFSVQVGVVPSEIGAQFGRFLILLNQLIPISLYVTLELVKVVQSYFLDHDIQMYHEPTETYARARTTNLNEDLGQVQYVMTDKTGTLTQNLMAFVQCSIGGAVYGNPLHSVKASDGAKSSKIHTIIEDENLQGMLKQIAEGTNKDATMACHAFLSHLAICHVIQPVHGSHDKPKEDPKQSITGHVDEGPIRYVGPSPDEEALVQGAADCGYRLMKRIADELQVEMPGLGLQKFAILATLEFTSERKRMSIICKDSKGRIKLYCKGADTVLFKRLERNQDDIIESTVNQLEEFARYGFRTLCMAQREISNAEYERWADQFRNASVALDERDEKVAAVAEEIERDLILLGATAVEDKLQAGVPETVTVLALAGIKVWVLTGDKLETSVSVGLACNLLADSMHLFLISDSVQKSVPQMLRSMLDEARRQQLSKLRKEGSYHSDMATVIEGISLSVALEDSNKMVFLELCQLCRSVICCRVSPIQKAQVTGLVKQHGHGVVLAIGDGANDVGMLKAAQIGVGIGGREGMAAVLASDYALTRFRHLRRLLLVHGRWSYKRNREVVLYAFYKNVVYVLGNIYLALYSGFSAQSLHTAAEISTFNLLWTSLSSFVFAIFDKDTSDCTAENNPQLYKETQSERRGQFFWCALGWFVVALWDSLVSFFIPLATALRFEGTGETAGIWSFGVTTYTMAIFSVNLKQLSRTHNFTLIHLGIFIFSLWIWILVLCVLSLMYKHLGVLADLSAVGQALTSSGSFWLLLILCPVVALLPVGALEIFRTRYAPEDAEVMREIEHGWIDGFFFTDAPDFVEHIPTSEPEVELLSIEVGQDLSTLHKEISEKRQATIKERGVEDGTKPEDEWDAHDDDYDINLDKPELESQPEEEKELSQPRRLTWREVTNEDELEDLDRSETLGRYGKRRSSGFQIVTRHTDQPDAPVPLVRGPTPPQRKSMFFERGDTKPTLTLTQARKQSRFAGMSHEDQISVHLSLGDQITGDPLSGGRGSAVVEGAAAHSKRRSKRDRKNKKEKGRILDLSRLDASPMDRIKSRTESLKPASSPRRIVAHAPRSSVLHPRPSRYMDTTNPPKGSHRPSSPSESPRSTSSFPEKHSFDLRKSTYETPTHSPRKLQVRNHLPRSRMS